MSEIRADGDDASGTVTATVERFAVRARRVFVAAEIRRAGPAIALAGAAAMAGRPLWWPTAAGSPWPGLSIAVASGLGIAAAGVLATTIVAWVRRPDAFAVATTIDDATGGHDLVASALGYEADGEPRGCRALTVDRARRVLSDVDPCHVFAGPSLRPGSRAAWLGAAWLVAALAGAYDGVQVAAWLDPPRDSEIAAAEALSRELAALSPPDDRPDRETRAENDTRGAAADEHAERALVERAREAAESARRGDRERALSLLSELGRDARERRRRAHRQNRSLEQLARTLSGPAGTTGRSRARPMGTPRPSEQMRLLSRRSPELRGDTPVDREQRRRLLERLSRAADEAERAGRATRREEEGRRVAEDLRRAADAVRAEREGELAEALERAAAASEALERAAAERGRHVERLARLLEASGRLERAVQRSMAGLPEGGDEGVSTSSATRSLPGDEPDGGALRRALAERLGRMGETSAGRGGQPGSGPEPHVPDVGGRDREALGASGDLHARSAVGEGRRAVHAVQGLGRNGEPTRELQDVFPTYDALAEEAMHEETVPASRRGVVRRYFEAIRP